MAVSPGCVQWLKVSSSTLPYTQGWNAMQCVLRPPLQAIKMTSMLICLQIRVTAHLLGVGPALAPFHTGFNVFGCLSWFLLGAVFSTRTGCKKWAQQRVSCCVVGSAFLPPSPRMQNIVFRKCFCECFLCNALPLTSFFNPRTQFNTRVAGLQPLEGVGQRQHRVRHYPACIPPSGCHMGGPALLVPYSLPLPGEPPLQAYAARQPPQQVCRCTGCCLSPRCCEGLRAESWASSSSSAHHF